MATALINEDDDTYEIPLKDQRVFGAGLKRKRVHFVPSGPTDATFESPPAQKSSSTISAGDRYLAIVSSNRSSSSTAQSRITKVDHELYTLPSSWQPTPDSSLTDKAPQPDDQICDICGLPVTTPISETSGSPLDSRPHAATLPHQVALPHSHPPSHLPRNSKGLSYLKAYGWDPDARLGLGVQGSEGRLYPIAVKEKRNTLGIGVTAPAKEEVERETAALDVLGLRELEDKKKVGKRRTNHEIVPGTRTGKNSQKLDAGRVRQREELDKRKMMRLQQMFYASDDVEKYLGS